MALSVAGLQLKRSFELSFSAGKIPVVIEKNLRQCGMSFPQFRITVPGETFKTLAVSSMLSNGQVASTAQAHSRRHHSIPVKAR
jgi:hypothetical protein